MAKEQLEEKKKATVEKVNKVLQEDGFVLYAVPVIDNEGRVKANVGLVERPEEEVKEDKPAEAEESPTEDNELVEGDE